MSTLLRISALRRGARNTSTRKSYPSGADNKAVDYESFVKFVRPLGLASSGEYIRWSKTPARPRGRIPCRPDLVYRDAGWTSWPDALGNDRTHGSVHTLEELVQIEADREIADSSIKIRKPMTVQYEQALCWFRKEAATLAPEYEFLRIEARTIPSLFFRKRGEPTQDWAALQLKATSAASKAWCPGEHIFSGVTTSSDIGKIFVHFPTEKVKVCHQSEIVTKSRSAQCRELQRSYVRIGIENDSALSDDPAGSLDALHHSFRRLDDLWAVLPRRPVSDWCESLAPRYSHANIHHRLSSAIGEKLYEPAGFDLKWHAATNDAPSAFGQRHNLLLGHYRCLQKVAYVTTTPKGKTIYAKVKLARAFTASTGRQLCTFYDAEDAIDYFPCLISENGGLTGVFFFPHSFLLEHGYLSRKSAGRRGRKAVVLYVPGSSPAPHKIALAKAQQKFFIDLSQGDSSDIHEHEHARQLKAIISEYGRSSTNSMLSNTIRTTTAVRASASA
ncbi:unnamed protein product [Amoebophrya sp. A25]|nr:unnamed protein product [Amoebophrya sp. A25]|eukprot:GSA25T00001806001.1